MFVENILRIRPPGWLPKPYASYDELLMASADQAVAQLERQTGRTDPATWNWGRIHTLKMFHPFGCSGLLRRLLRIGPLDQDGTVDAVKAMGHGHGPAMRFVADLANFDNSRMEIAAGESAQCGSPRYRDQFEEWRAGWGIPAPSSEAAAEQAKVHRLRQEPPGNPPPRTGR